MFRYIYFIIISCVLSACNTIDQSGYANYANSLGEPIKLKVETEPSSSTSKGECLADTLSFLIGQPETALAAMEYPADTRVLSDGQEVILEDSKPSRLNLVIGAERKIVNVFCG